MNPTHAAVYLLLIAPFLWFTSVSAQSVASVKLEPALTEDSVSGGEVFVSSLKVTNLGNSTQTLYLHVRDINGIDPNGSPIFSAQGEKSLYELSSWVNLEKQTVELAQGASVTVNYTVNVPADATPGAHFGSIFATTDPGPTQGQGAAVAFQVGAILSLNVNGDASEEAIIREFSTEKLLYSYADVNFTAKVENRGNTLLRPRGPVEIKDMFGKKKAVLIINDQAAAIGPKSERTFNVVWSDEGFNIGRYEALLGLTYGVTDKKTVSATVTFWILPMNIIGSILGVLFVLILLIYIGIKFYIRRALKDHGVVQLGNRAAVLSAKTAPFSRLALVLIVLLALLILFLIGMFVLLA